MTTALAISKAEMLSEAIQDVCKQNLAAGHADLCTYAQVAVYLNNGYEAYEMYMNNGCSAREVAECLTEMHEHVTDWWRVVGNDGMLEAVPAQLRREQYNELKRHGFQFNGPDVIL